MYQSYVYNSLRQVSRNEIARSDVKSMFSLLSAETIGYPYTKKTEKRINLAYIQKITPNWITDLKLNLKLEKKILKEKHRILVTLH